MQIMSGRKSRPQRLKPKHLESILQQLEGFPSPQAGLEQYQTPPEIAAHMLWFIDEHGPGMAGKVVLDLGCGAGTLGIGCILAGAEKVVGVDVDQAAIDVAMENKAELDLAKDSISFLCKDVRELRIEHFEPGIHFDMTVMNPPFGTSRGEAGIDTVFVDKALSLSDTVFSLHKSSTRGYWRKKEKENVSVKVVEEISFNLDASYKFHRYKSHDIKVDFLQFTSLPSDSK